MRIPKSCADFMIRESCAVFGLELEVKPLQETQETTIMSRFKSSNNCFPSI